MKNSFFQIFMILLYLVALLSIGYLLAWGLDYYMLPIQERPHDVLHSLLKPGGLWGHGYGVIGSSMILLLFLYSLRKRNLAGFRFGKIKNWLNVHIFFGIMGPLIITLHTAGKFKGLVSISYFSMLAVMISGFIGRYIYIQIPRDEHGHQLALDGIERRNHEITKTLVDQYNIPLFVMNTINLKVESRFGKNRKGLAAILTIIADDFFRPFRNFKLKRYISKNQANIPQKAVKQIIRLSKEKSLLYRRKIFLGTISKIFHYWHVIHKPFAWVMIIIMLIHVTVVVLMGYKWVF